MRRASPAVTEPCRSVHVPVETLRSIAPAAKKRGISPELLCFLIIDAVVSDRLIDAVLEDI